MAEKKQVLARSSIGAGLPIFSTAVVWLLLDRLHASDLVSGVVYTVVALVWLGCIHRLVTEKSVDIFARLNRKREGE